MRKTLLTTLRLTCPAIVLASMGATAPLGAQTLDTFGVLGASAVTNTGPTVILGNVGISPGPAGVVGFSVGNGTVTPPYAIYENESVAAAAQAELTTDFSNTFLADCR